MILDSIQTSVEISTKKKVSFSSQLPTVMMSAPVSALGLKSANILPAIDLCTKLQERSDENCCLGWIDQQSWQYRIYRQKFGQSATNLLSLDKALKRRDQGILYPSEK